MSDEYVENGRERPWRRRFSPLAIVGMVIGGIALAVLIAFLLGWIVMLLWNWLMPEIFRLPTIGYWQAWGLVLLAHILVKPGYGHGGDKSHGGSRRAHGAWKGEFRDRFRAECGGKPPVGPDEREPGSGADAPKDEGTR